jgi:uncharacterized protein YbjT (DUF2867 family)
MKTVAVLNAAGVQARAIGKELASAGFEVRLLSGSSTESGVSRVEGDDDAALARALEGAWGVVLTVPQDYRPGARETYAARVVKAAEEAGVARLVLNTAGPIFEELDRPVSAVARAVRETVRGSTVPSIVLQPSVYLENLLAPWSLEALRRQSVLAYPAPAEARISWMSHSSLGRFVAAALSQDEVLGTTIDLGGPQALTGPDLARIVGAAMDGEIRYAQMPLADFAAGLNAALGAPAGDDLADIYGYLTEVPDAAERGPNEWGSLHVDPETAYDWASRQQWPRAG